MSETQLVIEGFPKREELVPQPTVMDLLAISVQRGDMEAVKTLSDLVNRERARLAEQEC